MFSSFTDDSQGFVCFNLTHIQDMVAKRLKRNFSIKYVCSLTDVIYQPDDDMFAVPINVFVMPR